MEKLKTQPRLQEPDLLYEKLLRLHHGRPLEESLRIHSKLVFLLANHIGDDEVVLEAIERIGRDFPPESVERPARLGGPGEGWVPLPRFSPLSRCAA